MGTSLEQQAAVCLAQADYAGAIALYSQAIEANSTLRSNYWYLGLAHVLDGDSWEAQAVWLSVLTNATPEEVDGWTAELRDILIEAAQTSTDAARLQQATQIYEQILELDEEQAPVHDQLGQVLALQGRLEEAIACWRRAIELAPDCVNTYLQLADVLQKIELFEEAASYYFNFLNRVSNDWYATYNLGLCLLHLNRSDDAIFYLNQSIQLNPNFVPQYGDLGIAWLKKTDLKKAISCWHQAIAINPDFAQYYIAWADSLNQESRLDQATAMNADLLRGLLHQPESLETYLALGKLLANHTALEKMGISDQVAIAAFETALEYDPNSAEAYLELGKQRLKLGQVDQAIAAFKQALSLESGSSEILLEMGKALVQNYQLEEAITCYERVIESNANLTEVYFHLGDALSLKGDKQAAIRAYQQKIQHQPEAYDTYDAYFRLGVLFAEQGQLSEAIAHFNQAIKLAPRLAHAVHTIWEKLQHKQPSLDLRSLPLPVDPPDGFYESTEEWAIAHQLEKSHYFPVHFNHPIQLKPPQTLEPSIDLRFRFGEVLELPNSFVAIVPQGRYWIDEWNRTAVITSDNKLLGDVSPDFPILSPNHPDKHPSKHSALTVQKLPFIQPIAGTVAVLSALFNDAYFHWMFDVLPRLELIRSSGIDLAKIDYFLVNQSLTFQQESLAQLGILSSQILEPKDYPHIRADQLIVPSFPGTISWMPEWTCHFLQHLFLDNTLIAQTKPIERLYITRHQTSNRRVINEAEVIEVLEQFGFQSVALESMTIAEQAALIHHAKVIVAPHGGGLTNIVFCQPGTKIIELFSPNYVYSCYWFISNLLQFEHYYLLGEVPLGFQFNHLLHPNARTEDILINITRLTDTLRLANVI
ncbi:DUF563 domain-containing protein [Oscillatoria sp. FACHB-1407]|uniref:tetratricopeptide repeat protein n=1 Tax=Oscillatoria sp. FACHB-1407 TaxID=2692847 RepID=UPI0016834225|nr:tetratricopeptide repeat protein [Oscillatoria sp. FACHB-1407]MBD2464964.1 DUF563 domain-containing protein [Oscillatoria sp. FACHB-1407]